MTEANGDVTSYTYDNVYRLTDETKRDSQDNVLYRYQYTYDGVGNRLTETNTGEITYTHSLFAQGRLYDNNNKLTQLVAPGGTTTFGYDNNGNMTSMTQPGPVTTTYGYNYENRLTGVTNPSYTAAYTYSPDGLRLRVQESNAQYTDRWMQYDGVRPVLEGTLSGDTYTTTAKYVWEGESYYDSLMYSLIGGAWRYHLYDGLGSTRQLLQHSSPYNVTDTYQYEAFGNLLSSTGTTANPYKHVGALGYYQTGSSLMHLGARYYMPEIGRFLSQDPAGVEPDPYVYARDNPVIEIDPEGLKGTREHCEALLRAIRSALAQGGTTGCRTANDRLYDFAQQCSAFYPDLASEFSRLLDEYRHRCPPRPPKPSKPKPEPPRPGGGGGGRDLLHPEPIFGWPTGPPCE